MLNHITLMGRLTRDPELRRTGSGIACVNFTIAVDRDYSSKDSTEKEVDFIDCVAWRSSADFVSKHFTKGRMIVVSGRLQIRSWTDKEGNKRRNSEVVADNCYFGDSKKDVSDNYDGNIGGYSSPISGVPGVGIHEPQFPVPEYPASDFAMLDDEDSGQLPF